MAITPCSSVQCFWQDGGIESGFRSGVSLHSHTLFSREGLAMVGRFAEQIPWLGMLIRQAAKRRGWTEGKTIDFENAYWTPPLSPRQAYRLEEKQIQRRFQLPAIVSLSDHDDIRAGSSLRVIERFAKVPISTEWTVPYEATFFHIGVHNLPAADAPGIAAELARFTANPDPANLRGALEMLNSLPDVLLVLNHPLWDEKGIGLAHHKRALGLLLAQCKDLFHALELNGLRSWPENQGVIAVAKEIDLPVLAGGDRHGREANAILNLSRATDFPGFVEEVKHDRFSHNVLMPQYNEPLRLRVMHTLLDVLRNYPENVLGRKGWSDRVFYQSPNASTPISLAEMWGGKDPMIIRIFVGAVLSMEWPAVRSALGLAMNAGNAEVSTD